MGSCGAGRGGTLQKQRCSKAASQPDTQRLDVIERGRELISLVSQNRMAELECPEMPRVHPGESRGGQGEDAASDRERN